MPWDEEQPPRRRPKISFANALPMASSHAEAAFDY
jgi:hypothetical protein